MNEDIKEILHCLRVISWKAFCRSANKNCKVSKFSVANEECIDGKCGQFNICYANHKATRLIKEIK